MKTTFIPQPILYEKAIEALIEKLGISKATEFWVSLGYGRKDYTQLRKKLFKGKTIDALYKEIQQIEKREK